MMGPSPAELARYAPKAPPGVVELNIGDQWRAKWVDADELPGDAPVFYAYALVARGEKGYVTRRTGENGPWGTVEGSLDEGEGAEDFVRRAAMAMIGATVSHIELVGFLECKATSHNRDFPVGSITVRPLYVAVASSVDDIPEDSGYERRRLPLNQHHKALRERYPEIDEYIGKAAQRYAVLHARGEA
jgi:ADP-ribose pyrophosphatase YjhB (NUDIX family)